MPEPTRSGKDVDLVVVGAGVHGLVAAKTYLDVNPSARITILESASSVGGTWATDRQYPGLKSNNVVGSYEFSDFPLDAAAFGVKPGEHIPGPVLLKYFEAYADKFDLRRRIKLRCRVDSVERDPQQGGWLVKHTQHDQAGTTATEKLIVATGLTSEPFVPSFRGSEEFDSPIFHVKYLREHAADEVKNVVILGGSKSAYDAAYAYAERGATIDWVIRESGRGSCWMAPVHVTPLKQKLEDLVGTRFVSWFSPCLWGDEDGFPGIRHLLHNTRIGRSIVDMFFSVLNDDLVTRTGYHSHPEISKLKPRLAPFWHSTSLGILNYSSDIFEYVRNGTIRVHIADIDHLSPSTVHLSNATTLHADALVCSTGWDHRPSLRFLPAGVEADLGLPHSPSAAQLSSTELQEDIMLRARADAEILKRFPRLATQPSTPSSDATGTSGEDALKTEAEQTRSFCLFRFMVPPASINERDLAFAGSMLSIYTALCAQTQALWITAYFSGQLKPRPALAGEVAHESSSPTATFDLDKVKWEAMLAARYCRLRYPAGYGTRFPDFVFDTVPYIDVLLRDLGLPHRRKRTWLEEVFAYYRPSDYTGLVDQWRVASRLPAPGKPT
ncbi:MAG: hypothetical protein M1838_002130 [Thelocarpon superellum]|nr:MAG: hypothetical protein M1838_002130 [Thelocarpon superellum]